MLENLSVLGAMKRVTFATLLVVVTLGGTARAQDTLPIAAIHANLGTYTGQIVTVEGVVTVPANYRGPSFYSGYIQDGSGRGLNVFGGSTAPPFALNTVGNRVRVTGEVAVFSSTTVELTNITAVTQVSSGSALAPIQLSTLAANDARWEGTLIEVSGNVDSVSAVTGGARNYYVNDGTGRIVARAYTTLGLPTFAVGQHVTARGAGTNFNGLYEFYVGQFADMFVSTPTADTSAPVLIGAWAPSATQIIVTFGEALETTSGGTAANYTVFETANPTATVGVATSTLLGPVATLALSASLVAGTDYTVRASNVRDLADNAVAAPLEIAIQRVVGPVDNTPPTLTAAAAPGLSSVTATFSEAIDPTTGGTTGNYAVFPAGSPGSPVAISGVVVAGATATLTLGANLTGGSAYTLRAQNIQDLAGNAMAAPEERNFTAPGGGTVTPIATIQNNLRQYKGQTVTVQGQVYIPSNYRGSTISGYIQDESGRGINLFGSTMNVAALQTIGNNVQVTATVDTFFTTVELLNATSVTLLGNTTRRQPQQLSTGAAASRSWEGTFIEIAGPITAKVTQSSAINYTVNDGTGNIVVRVVSTIAAPEFNIGQTITARGAGGQFQQDFQVLVGLPSDISLGSGPDTTPPTLTGATAPSLTSVRATFSEPIDTVSGGTVGNYSVYPTSNPTALVPISSVSVAGSQATLALGSTLAAGTNYTLSAQNIADLSSNVMTAPGTATFTPTTGPATTPIADIQNNLRQYKGQTVTVEGQVYIPTNYRGATTSGYIQDGSGRGINLFGSTMNVAALQNIGNIVRVTAVVDTYFTTIELVNATNITVVTSGNPPLQPQQLSTGAAANSQWEGTYIEVTGPITAKVTQTGAINYTVNDGSGNLVVRVVSTVGAAEFNTGQTITARGAGGQFQQDFQLLVGLPSNIFTGGSDTTPPSVTGVTTPNLSQAVAAFSEAVTTATGNQAANYTLFETASPGVTVPVTSAVLATNRRSATLSLGSALVAGRGYSLRVTGLADDANNTMTAPQTVTFTATVGPATTPIADIQNNLRQFKGQTVTVQGQIYIPTNYRGTTISGYIQDGSGRGINLFGSSMNSPLLQNVGNIVRLTAVVDTFFTTVELLNGTGITLVSSGNPPLVPTVLSTGAAASSAWEGTYILVTGTITAKVVQSGAINYTLDDDTGPIVARVVSTVGATEFNVGQLVTARGAGGQFQSDFQVLVGEASAIFEGEPVDTFPPALVGALATGTQTLRVDFNEAVTQSTAEVAANYEVFRTANPTETVPVTSARLVREDRVELALGAAIDVSQGWTLRVSNVMDLLGNPIPAAGVTRVIELAPAEVASLDGPANTFLPRLGELYPITFTVPPEVASGRGQALLRIYDMRGRLQRTLFDSRFESASFTNNRVVRDWDGRDDRMNYVPAGAYVVHLLVSFERGDEDTQQLQMPVVVATRLDR